ncbi:MAG: TonB family protein [Syntrophobacteraceae bacterium]
MDLSFLDDPLDVAASGYRALEVSVLSDRKTWSSLAAVLFLHVALACILWVAPKPHPGSHDWIEVQLVSLQGCPDPTGLGMQEGSEAGGAAHSATAPENHELPDTHPATENDTKLQAAPRNNSRPAPHPKKTQTAAVHPRDPKEIKCEPQSNPAQTEVGANQSEGSSQASGAGTGTAAGASNQGGAEGKGAPGRTGVMESSFGSPEGPSFLHKVSPAYPALARKLDKEGTVLLRVTIDERGRPVQVEVLTKAGFGFDEEAVRAVQGSTFVPAKKEGKALACKALLPIRFVLKNS